MTLANIQGLFQAFDIERCTIRNIGGGFWQCKLERENVKVRSPEILTFEGQGQDVKSALSQALEKAAQHTSDELKDWVEQ